MHVDMTLDTETFSILKDSVHRFVQERLIPNEDRVEVDDDVPAEIVAEMKALGLFGLSIPEEYGGIGLSMAEEVEICMELGQTALAFRSVFGTNVGIGSQGILMDGTQEQKQTWLPKIASGDVIISFALTSTANESAIKGAGGISAFIVPRSTPGITLGKIDKKMGQRGTKTYDVIFDNARVPAANIIGGKPGVGFKTAMKVLDRGRFHISAMAAGMHKRILKEALDYAVQRKQFGQAIAEFQLIQGMLADMQTELYASECMVRDGARRYDAAKINKDPQLPMLAAACKYFTTESVGRSADKAVQIHGGAGYMSEYKVERFYRDVRLLRLYEGTSQIQQVIIAKNLLKGL